MTYKEITTRALNAFRVKDLELAEDLTRRILSEYPDNADLHLFMGNIKTRRGMAEEALSFYGKAIALRPESPEGYNNLSVACRMTGDLDRALQAAEKARGLSPGRADIA